MDVAPEKSENEKSEREKSENEKSEHQQSEHQQSENEKSEREKSEHQQSENEKSEHQQSEHKKSEHKKSEHQERDALGYSRGGLTSKIHVVCDGQGRPLCVVVSGGRRHDSTVVETALDAVRVPRKQRGRPRKRPKSLNMDKGYSFPRCRRLLRARGIAAMIPERRDQRERRQKRGRKGGRPAKYDHERYALRNVVERCILSLKRFRRVATRYDKRAVSYHAFVTLAAIFIWLRSLLSDTT